MLSRIVVCLEEFNMLIFDTKGGHARIVRKQIFWTDSILFQFEGDISGPQAGPAYVRIGRMYI